MDDRDFEVLYRDDPPHVRANANLPGAFIYPVASLEFHGSLMESVREALEAEYPGFCRKEDCGAHGVHWTWRDFGVPDAANPVGDFILPYLQLSRSEDMKGSEQTTRGFLGTSRGPLIDGAGAKPELYPRTPLDGQSPLVVVQNGYSDMKRQTRRAWFRRKK